MKSNPPPKLPLFFTTGKRVPSPFPVMGGKKRDKMHGGVFANCIRSSVPSLFHRLILGT